MRNSLSSGITARQNAKAGQRRRMMTDENPWSSPAHKPPLTAPAAPGGVHKGHHAMIMPVVTILLVLAAKVDE